MPQSSPSRSALPAFLGVVAALAGNLFAQSAVTLSSDTPFFKDPGGTRLGTLVSGGRVSSVRSSGGFTLVRLEAWIFTISTRVDQREGYDLSVSLPQENLRTAPGGVVLGRAVQGTLFKSQGTRGGWTRVQRTVWIPDQTVRRSDGPTVSSTAGQRAAEPPSRQAAEPSTEPPSQQATLRKDATLRRSPDGPSIAKSVDAAEVRLGEATGEWVKVILEGWVRRTEVDSAVVSRPAVTGAMLRENPDRYVGQTVDWRVQFLALQQADELRPEMPVGQPYLLVRGPLPESGFAYVMIAKNQVAELSALSPLEELALTVTVRAGRTRYLATPVVEWVRRNR